MNNTQHKRKKPVSLPKLVRLILLFTTILFFSVSPIYAQQKSKKIINIEHADLLKTDENVVADARRLIGNVHLTHDNIVMYCDSAWFYTRSNIVDAFGRVHIISNDTVNIWADFINYNGETGLAKARHNVKLEDPAIKLTTDSLDFDMETEIGYYEYGGEIVDSANVLNSIIGRYYTQKNEFFFTHEVTLINDNYNIFTDTMIYNTDTEVVIFEGDTKIIGDSTNIYSSEGWFNTKNNQTRLGKNSTIRRGNTQIQAENLFYDDNSDEGYASGNVIINDYANKMIVLGQKAEYDDFDKYALVTDSAVWIQYYDNDSLFLHADTLYTIPDTAAVDAKLLITYNNVSFYRSDIQGVGDSLVYYTRDSTIQLFNDPVLWSMENQMTADFIEFKNNTTKPSEVYLTNNSFIIQEVDSTRFNQIKGKNMVGYIRNQELYQIKVNGNGQSIYYPADDDELIGVNKAESSNIVIYLSDNQIKRITFLGSPVGVMNPLIEVKEEDTILPGFNWREDERPRNRHDIFGIQKDSTHTPRIPNPTLEKELPSMQEEQKNIEKRLQSKN
ncbi:MAG: organic solvent tolerance protein OstA [Prolixibacteraceae bacterium]|nr:organic solvent tolerance protein OstA [Prolixibacteraceae bacterium]MBN2650617.1 organic solvent tolerance protein OstA [Prolixibacteraceae bacterium]